MRKLLIVVVVLIAGIAGSMAWTVRRVNRRADLADEVNARSTVGGFTQPGNRTGADAIEPPEASGESASDEAAPKDQAD